MRALTHLTTTVLSAEDEGEPGKSRRTESGPHPGRVDDHGPSSQSSVPYAGGVLPDNEVVFLDAKRLPHGKFFMTDETGVVRLA